MIVHRQFVFQKRSRHTKRLAERFVRLDALTSTLHSFKGIPIDQDQQPTLSWNLTSKCSVRFDPGGKTGWSITLGPTEPNGEFVQFTGEHVIDGHRWHNWLLRACRFSSLSKSMELLKDFRLARNVAGTDIPGFLKIIPLLYAPNHKDLFLKIQIKAADLKYDLVLIEFQSNLEWLEEESQCISINLPLLTNPNPSDKLLLHFYSRKLASKSTFLRSKVDSLTYHGSFSIKLSDLVFYNSISQTKFSKKSTELLDKHPLNKKVKGIENPSSSSSSNSTSNSNSLTFDLEIKCELPWWSGFDPVTDDGSRMVLYSDTDYQEWISEIKKIVKTVGNIIQGFKSLNKILGFETPLLSLISITYLYLLLLFRKDIYIIGLTLIPLIVLLTTNHPCFNYEFLCLKYPLLSLFCYRGTFSNWKQLLWWTLRGGSVKDFKPPPLIIETMSSTLTNLLQQKSALAAEFNHVTLLNIQTPLLTMREDNESLIQPPPLIISEGGPSEDDLIVNVFKTWALGLKSKMQKSEMDFLEEIEKSTTALQRGHEFLGLMENEEESSQDSKHSFSNHKMIKVQKKFGFRGVLQDAASIFRSIVFIRKELDSIIGFLQWNNLLTTSLIYVILISSVIIFCSYSFLLVPWEWFLFFYIMSFFRKEYHNTLWKQTAIDCIEWNDVVLPTFHSLENLTDLDTRKIANRIFMTKYSSYSKPNFGKRNGWFWTLVTHNNSNF